MKLSQYTDVVWDFNGTILDDLEAAMASINKLLSDRNMHTLGSVEEYHSVFGFPIIEYYKRLGFDFEKESYAEIAPIWVAEYLNRVKSSKLRAGVDEILDLIAERGIPQHLLSATELTMLGNQVASLGIGHYFASVSGLDNIHAASKESLAVKWMEEHPAARPLFIGDTTHDAEVAEAVSADCILVAGGHQSRDTLLSAGVPVADGMRALYRLFEN